MSEFLYKFNAKNLVKEKTCFKSLDNPSCIDLFLTNVHQSFQNTTVSTGLSDFHKMVVTIMKMSFPKAKPKIVQYRDEKNFIEEDFRVELRGRLQNVSHFDKLFLKFLINMLHLKRRFIEQIINPI